ncbi:hypothetical protein [Thermococcus sp. MAR1]|uniref:hypothetical protein n=1 Tax=Thermococcus sp. MAR1 TaxID=1638263 RepID=UPI0014390CDB|nr:hypothetical protein [Thermococcus sp. MAR1]NJE09338.1 hypothetical protein [Thermococcus sp. MAR1]
MKPVGKKHIDFEAILGHEALIGSVDVCDVKLITLSVDMCLLKEEPRNYEISPRCLFKNYFAQVYDVEKDRDVVVEKNWKENRELWLIRVFEVTKSGIEEVEPLKIEATYLWDDDIHFTATYALFKNRNYIVLERFINDLGQEAFVLYRLIPRDEHDSKDTFLEGKFVEKDKFEVDHIVARADVADDQRGNLVDIYGQAPQEWESVAKTMDRFEALVKRFIEVQLNELYDDKDVKEEDRVLDDEGLINALVLAYLVHLSLEKRL